MQQRKKRLIILCSILSVVLVIVVLASTLFNLKSVRVEFKNLRCVLNENTISSASIVDAGKFDFGSNILFKDVDEYANNIEKTFGYAQVLKIERIFPSSYTVHIAEREPCVLVKKGEEFVLLYGNQITKGLECGDYDAVADVLKMIAYHFIIIEHQRDLIRMTERDLFKTRCEKAY